MLVIYIQIQTHIFQVIKAMRKADVLQRCLRLRKFQSKRAAKQLIKINEPIGAGKRKALKTNNYNEIVRFYCLKMSKSISVPQVYRDRTLTVLTHYFSNPAGPRTQDPGPVLYSMGIVASIRQESAVATEQDVSIRYYICSKELEAQTLLEATRSHWGVEVMHWSLDTAFCEDNSRIRADDRAEAFARIGQMCLNLLKSETTFKGGIKRKRMNSAMDENYLSKVLENLTCR